MEITSAALSTFIGFVYFPSHFTSSTQRKAPPKMVFTFSRRPSSNTRALQYRQSKSLCSCCCAWRSNNKKVKRVRMLKRCCALLSLSPLLIFAVFAAGVFVSRVATLAYRSNDILAQSTNCSYWAFDCSSMADDAAQQTRNAKDTLMSGPMREIVISNLRLLQSAPLPISHDTL